ncbi:MAG: chorismate mutase, partial [Candidatus Fimenecus sp.]|nr:chorismate mutase [Candidatus Fimenecus sp.]
MNLEQLRSRIDEIDSQMVELFKDRMEIATDIARYKKENKLPVLDKTRERALLNKIAEMSGEEFENYSLRLYSQILELSRTYQHKCLGNKS